MVQLLALSSLVKPLPNHRLACLNSGGGNRKNLSTCINKYDNLKLPRTGKCIKEIACSFYTFSSKDNIVKTNLVQTQLCSLHHYYWENSFMANWGLLFSCPSKSVPAFYCCSLSASPKKTGKRYKATPRHLQSPQKQDYEQDCGRQ